MSSAATDPAGGLAYVDTSALAKLLLVEPESEAFAAVVAEWPALASSTLTEVELHRVAYREAVPADRADDILAAVALVDLDADIREDARRVGDPGLRALDALHVATAASLGLDLGVLFSYDTRMQQAARLEGLPVLAPGQGEELT